MILRNAVENPVIPAELKDEVNLDNSTSSATSN